ncbi:distal tail protein Dit [Bacillus cereus group sp. TH152-1LC]|uniref:distal tail protein Dit n=1 Tax=Bacillus cereus group sp. TH152-1LC TaxID=3018060 RepID=UPI0022E950C5|nr:distal tail protein Dit [Bacillus cereus group sp. TH152-1LC]MDA1681008.1 phage tail family protein [Bacillus cereus group sp. TH152-1LC]
MSSFTFNNQRKEYIQIERGWSPPTWAPLKRNFLKVPGFPGARLLNTDTDPRPLPVPVGIIVPDGTDLETLKEEIAEWLITEESAELIFDTKPDRTYIAVIDEDFNIDDFVTLGKGTLKFICPMPYKLGPVQNKTLAIDKDGNLKAAFRNKGSVESNPIIDIMVGAKSTFLDVWNGNDYFRLGYPVAIKTKIVNTEERLIWDKMDSSTGWVHHNGKIGRFDAMGTMLAKDGYFYPANFGTGSEWHGCFMVKDIPPSPTGEIIDFKFDVQMTLKSSNWNQMGKVVAMVLDKDNNVICQVDMSDEYMAHEYTIAHASVSSAGDNPTGDQVTIANEHGALAGVWNQFNGHFALARRGNHWRCYPAKYDGANGTDGTSSVHEWYDLNYSNPLTKREPKKIALGFVAYGDYPPVTDLRISDFKFWKLNKLQIDETPYIFDVGDKIQIDTEHSLVTINGTNAIALKDIFSSFPVVKRGQNEIIVRPANVGISELTYRERFR